MAYSRDDILVWGSQALFRVLETAFLKVVEN